LLPIACIVIRNIEMTIPVTELKAGDGEVVDPAADAPADAKPWQKLRGTGELLATAEESVFEDSDFEALR
jgi:hypothetical protein